MRKIKGLIFDFDGLIIDSETPTMQAWQEIYESFGFELPLDKYYLTIGTTDHLFDPLCYLEELVPDGFLLDEIRSKHQTRTIQLIDKNDLLPGVHAYLIRAKELNLKLGIATSAINSWVHYHLINKNISEYFDCVITSDEISPPKPEPNIYLAVLEKLRLSSQEAIAFEDSPNGITAAQRAGIFCVAVPNQLTKSLDTSHADLLFSSFHDKSLDELIAFLEVLD